MVAKEENHGISEIEVLEYEYLTVMAIELQVL
jgi:hypothetical protein